jgi:NAD(P)-dependent dehydrogenase (short-subunit alcohol dehydrogenase family)
MTLASLELTNKVSLVTGANAGLGLGFARGLAKAGSDVVIWGRRAARNEQAARELRGHGVRVLAQEVDVADEGEVRDAMRAAVAAMGRIDGVIANAGISSRPPSFHEMSSDMWHELLAVNLHGAFHTLREAAAHMVARAQAGDKGGSLVVCGSLAALVGVPRLEHYAAAKGALAAVVRCIAVEYGGSGIRANMIAPGYFESDLARDPEVARQRAEQMRQSNPIPRPGVAEDLEGVAVYLLSDASRYHTGDVLVVDGGAAIAL